MLSEVFCALFRRVSPCVRFVAKRRGSTRRNLSRRVGRFSRFVELCQNLRCIKQRVPVGTFSAYYDLPDIKTRHKRRVKKIIYTAKATAHNEGLKAKKTRPVLPRVALCTICCEKTGKYTTKPFAPCRAFFAVCESENIFEYPF